MEVDDLIIDLFKYKRKSLYKIAKTFGENRLNLPYDYTKDNEIVKRTLSNHILRNNIMEVFLRFINDFIVLMIKGVNYIRLKRVYTVDKDYKYIK